MPRRTCASGVSPAERTREPPTHERPRQVPASSPTPRRCPTCAACRSRRSASATCAIRSGARAGGQVQSVLATLQMTVGLPHDVKGTHMSRFVEVLERQREPLDLDGVPRAVRGDARAPRRDDGPPVDALPLLHPQGRAGVGRRRACSTTTPRGSPTCATPGDTRVTVSVTAPVTSLCPCSKKISDYGAHNQRSHITIRAELRGASIALEELARVAEDEASCEVCGPAQAPGREVGDRARLRQPEVRRGPGARHRAAPHRRRRVAAFTRRPARTSSRSTTIPRTPRSKVSARRGPSGATDMPRGDSAGSRIAVVGSGIAGLGSRLAAATPGARGDGVRGRAAGRAATRTPST